MPSTTTASWTNHGLLSHPPVMLITISCFMQNERGPDIERQERSQRIAKEYNFAPKRLCIHGYHIWIYGYCEQAWLKWNFTESVQLSFRQGQTHPLRKTSHNCDKKWKTRASPKHRAACRKLVPRISAELESLTVVENSCLASAGLKLGMSSLSPSP